MIRLVRAEFTKLRTTRLLYGMAAAMAAFAVLTVVALMTDSRHRGQPRAVGREPAHVRRRPGDAAVRAPRCCWASWA